jgi:signal transduction histidine kinase
MKTINSPADRESPARRLQILYIASLSAVALITGISQTLILRELSWQGNTLHFLGLSVSQQSLEHSLRSTALALQAADGPEARRESARALREAVQLSERGAQETAAGKEVLQSAKSGAGSFLQDAEAHRRSAVRSAEALLATVDRQGPAAALPADAAPRVRTIVDEAEAFRRATVRAIAQAESEAFERISRLKALEFKLFLFVMVVLLLEGLFVISPAVRNIQRFMADMGRSHDELKTYAAKLERSNKELQDFASVASHDLQEPLRKVQAFSDRLKIKCAPALDAAGLDYLDRIQNAARRMQTLINDLLTYARVTTKAQPFVPIDLVSATREVVSDLEARIEQVGGRVEVGELPTLDADPLQVRQLMQNLIGNALKYHRPGVPPVVRVHAKHSAAPPAPHSASACEILIEDNGIGFEEIYAERIFTIFQRLHGRNEYEGTGVGLAVCRKIVERHGGSITARSKPGEGSTFVVTLPVQQPKETSSHEHN